MPAPQAALRASVHIAAPIDRVWAAWSSPDHLAGWFPDRVEGTLGPGDRARLCWDCYGLELPIEVEDVDAERRLVFRGSVDGRRTQRQSVALEPTADGTRVVIDHDGFVTADERAGSAAGWQTALAALRLYVERYFGAARETFAVMTPVSAAFEELFSRYTDAAGLASWLTDAGHLGEPGEPTALALRGGAIITGRVVARVPPREVALWCRELEGVIALKAFSLAAGAPGPMLAGAWVSSWAPDAPLLASLRVSLERAFADLAADLGPTDTTH